MTRILLRSYGSFLILLIGALSAAPAWSTTPLGVAKFRDESMAALRLVVRDHSGAPLDARVQVLDEAGEPIWPRGPGHRRYDAYSGHHYFYATGPVTLGSRTGPVRITASRGPEYTTYDAWIPPGTTDVTVVLDRLVDMRERGWYSGDTHVHVAHGGGGAAYTITPDDLAVIARAEDLAMVFALSNGLYFSGRQAVSAGPGHLLHFGMEFRSAIFGHMGLLGLSTLLQPGCCLTGDPAYPMNLQIAAEAHAQEAVVVASHPTPMNPSLLQIDDPAWPYSGFSRELPADIVFGGVDAIDVLSYTNEGTEYSMRLWFDLLNLGYRPALSVGTDASVNRWFDPPAGGYRVYVRLAPEEEFTMESWLDGLLGGATFVTNGPLPFHWTLNGKGPGETVSLPSTTSQIQGHVVAYTKDRLSHLDVYHNGSLRNRHYLPLHYDLLDYSFHVTVPPTDGWVVFVLRGSTSDPSSVGTGKIAITSPIFLAGGPRSDLGPYQEKYDAWLEQLQGMVAARPVGDPQNQEQVLSTLENARMVLTGIPAAPSPAPLSAAPRAGAPTLRAAGGMLLATGRGSASVQWFDAGGRLRYATEAQSLPAGFPVPHLFPSGVYFARLVGEDGGVLAVTRLVKTD